MLYRYAQRVGVQTVKLDLLRNTVVPPASRLSLIYRRPNFDVIIGFYRAMLFALLERRGVPKDWVAEAIFSIEFESETAESPHPKGEKTESFACRLTVTDDLGRERVYRIDGRCWPHSPQREMKRMQT